MVSAMDNLCFKTRKSDRRTGRNASANKCHKALGQRQLLAVIQVAAAINLIKIGL